MWNDVKYSYDICSSFADGVNEDIANGITYGVEAVGEMSLIAAESIEYSGRQWLSGGRWDGGNYQGSSQLFKAIYANPGVIGTPSQIYGGYVDSALETYSAMETGFVGPVVDGFAEGIVTGDYSGAQAASINMLGVYGGLGGFGGRALPKSITRLPEPEFPLYVQHYRKLGSQNCIDPWGIRTETDDAAFWSGRSGANRAAAEASRLTTLEKTPAGQSLDA